MSDASEYVEKLIAKAKGDGFWSEAGVRPPERTERNSVEADGFDRLSWAWMTDQIPALGKQVADLGEDFETSPWAYEDLFNLMFKSDPQPTPEPVLEEKFKPQALMMNLIGKSEELRHLRHETELDDYNTSLAMLTMRDKMRKAFEDLTDAIAAAETAGSAVSDALVAAQQALASGEGLEEAAEALANALAAQGRADRAAEDGAGEAASSMRGAADQATEAIENERSLMSGWGLGPGQLQKMSFAERRALAERLHKSRLAKFAKMLGAQRISADAERRRSLRHAPARTADTELGNNLARLAPDELAKLGVPELEDDFALRFVKRRLRLKKWTEPPRLDRGPKIVVCDESYSMNDRLDNEGNTREMWSKAVALAVCDAARRDHCDFIYIGFASAGEMWESHFPQGVVTMDKIMEFTEHFFAGGTYYDNALNRAMEICLEYAAARRPRPDIVFITDDECRVSEEFVEQWRIGREEADVRCYGIQVGGSGQYQTMQSLTDRQLSISALNSNPDGVTELFRNM